MSDDLDKPTELTRTEIEKFAEMLMPHEIKEKKCFICSKSFYFDSYGQAFGENIIS